MSPRARSEQAVEPTARRHATPVPVNSRKPTATHRKSTFEHWRSCVGSGGHLAERDRGDFLAGEVGGITAATPAELEPVPTTKPGENQPTSVEFTAEFW